jgi:kynurenine formamidase
MKHALAAFIDSLNAGDIHIVDLTQTLSPELPTLVLPANRGKIWPFRLENICNYDQDGPDYLNNFSCGEHTGTHFDAPAHWVTGKDYPNNTVDTIECKNFLAPASVVDASSEVESNPDWLLTVDFLEQWEAKNGRIQAGTWLFFRTDWSKRISDPASFLNLKEDGAHTPGPTQAAVEWLIDERNVHGFAVETLNTDAGQSYQWPIPFPCHNLMHGANRYGLQCLKNLDQLPPTGALIFSAPLKIKAGSGSPLRVLAFVPNQVD